MSLYGAFAKENHFSELASPLPYLGDVLTPTERRNAAFQNLTGDSDITAAQVAVLSGVTAGTVEAGKVLVAGAASDDVLDFSSLTLAANKGAIKLGSYSVPMALGGPSDILTQIHAQSSGSDDSGYHYCLFSSMWGSDDEDDNLIGIHNTTHAAATGSSYPKTVQAIQGHAALDAGAKLATRGGDTTAGLYAAWFKVYSAADAVMDSGSYSAAIWLDNQHSGTMNGTEYSVFSSTGGTVPDAWAGFSTTSAGWAALFDFQNDAAPVGASGLANAGSAAKTLKIMVNGSPYYLIAYDPA